MVPRSPRRAFTLIEILVVITIIGILAAILFPVFGRARENARRSSCQSNLRQIGLGLLQYAQDFDEKLPRSFYGSSGDSDMAANYKWMDAIFPHVKNEQVFDCPSDALSPLYHFRSGQNYGSYGLNGAYGTAGDSQTPPRSSTYLIGLSQLAAPASTVWVTDNNNAATPTNPSGSQGFYWTDAANNPAITGTFPRQLQNIIERHLDTTNVLYCDGHAKAQKLTALAATKTLVDPLDGQTKNVMTAFTIEDD